ncbi:pirin family protein [Nocardioides sp. Bht2]|uniref:pirin family protein n=1 Tax=Nocardioides sp. Bht2 TaxID=3392297 RepID=UPI0039B3E4F8
MLILRSGQRTAEQVEGRQTRHSFSFGSAYDPDNLRFGLLVCHNDDLIAPGYGYDEHPHSHLEVVTWVLEGALSHRDSRGNTGELLAGQAQVMSAGDGLRHSETVDPAAGTTRFIQAWVLPDEPGGEPRYSTGSFALDASWTPVAAGTGHDAAARLRAGGATLWAARPGAGELLTVPSTPFAHLFVASGTARLSHDGGTVDLDAGDAVRFRDEQAEVVTATASELLLWTFA